LVDKRLHDSGNTPKIYRRRKNEQIGFVDFVVELHHIILHRAFIAAFALEATDTIGDILFPQVNLFYFDF